MIILQLLLYCLFYTGLVKLYVGNNAINGLYFYPKPVQERAIHAKLIRHHTVAQGADTCDYWYIGDQEK